MSFRPGSRRKKQFSRALADDTLGAVVVRPLSRGSGKVRALRPYIPCMSPVEVKF